jgi:hypothetical protein
MAKKMYVPNTIGIPTHGVDLWHHGLRLANRNPKSQGEGRKKERGGRRGPEASCRASHAEWASMTESHHINRRDSGGVIESCHVRRRDSSGVTQATWWVLCHGGA